MADFDIPEKPDYIASIRKFETSDPAHADLLNVVFQAVINNIEYLRTRATVKVGHSDTVLDSGDTLFVVDDELEGVSYSNFTLSQDAPETENWGMVEGELAVSEAIPADATFYANINE